MLTISKINQKTGRELKIAVTGHRRILISEELENSIIAILVNLIDQFEESDIYMLCPLAEGSDQLVAKLAKRFSRIKLVVPLPLPMDEYLSDFDSDFSKQEFFDLQKNANHIYTLPTVQDHQFAYHNLGKYLVNECDCLLSIWNGKYTNKIGGTGDVVKMAVNAEKPVYWIYTKSI